MHHEYGIACHAGYILGFPSDTPQTIAEDVDVLKELGFDQVSFFMLTPLPGSEDHIRQYVAGTPMDEDLNNYDSFQPVIDHPLMSRNEWQEAYNRAWRQFYTARQDERGSAAHIPGRILGDVPKFSLVPMECRCRRRSSHAGGICSTQTLREPTAIGGENVANGTHDEGDLAVRALCRTRLPGILRAAARVLRKLHAGPRGRWHEPWENRFRRWRGMSAILDGSDVRSAVQRIGNG
jgi:hypothetical protein